MNLNEIVRQLKQVEYALNNIEVKGRENMDLLLGSMNAVHAIAAQVETSMREMEPPATKPEDIQIELAPAGEQDRPAE